MLGEVLHAVQIGSLTEDRQLGPRVDRQHARKRGEQCLDALPRAQQRERTENRSAPSQLREADIDGSRPGRLHAVVHDANASRRAHRAGKASLGLAHTHHPAGQRCEATLDPAIERSLRGAGEMPCEGVAVRGVDDRCAGMGGARHPCHGTRLRAVGVHDGGIGLADDARQAYDRGRVTARRDRSVELQWDVHYRLCTRGRLRTAQQHLPASPPEAVRQVPHVTAHPPVGRLVAEQHSRHGLYASRSSRPPRPAGWRCSHGGRTPRDGTWTAGTWRCPGRRRARGSGLRYEGARP